jgi:hypothetical protein
MHKGGKENKNEMKNDQNYIKQFHYKGTVLVEPVKVACRTTRFCGTHFECHCCREMIKQNEFHTWTPTLMTSLKLKWQQHYGWYMSQEDSVVHGVPGANYVGHKADNSPPSSMEARNSAAYTSTPVTIGTISPFNMMVMWQK